MPRATWPLQGGRPCVCVVLALADGAEVDAKLLPDTGGGSIHSSFDLILPEADCLLCGGKSSAAADLEDAYCLVQEAGFARSGCLALGPLVFLPAAFADWAVPVAPFQVRLDGLL